ncbi:hypothetical protein [Vibrio crassostreae]|uniref:hypothetical protein n=1 Tax=Vibrio crassostreae TaxID=246167 RepID=UPI0010504994|nr:hypothetical protein [Vibrio crassostreae]TCO05764.1 hypothetical protein EDB30_102342 [Vibrio crassostreae]CAK2389008.1 conserved hypothetical protein [Vibrio crassostreae]CAK2585630.1 conserved hypothetical protein [Vibrio crassostreae]CAK2597363.1 conserved hypothetical protein [Vibrio crassostreae]CAK2784001.1 conserved hypothetical protein [Vibrio crassostreae]
MQIEKLLAKFNVKGINYDLCSGGKGGLSLDEQLAIVGLAWKEAPVGFLVLFVEYLQDRPALNKLYQTTLQEANTLMDTWRGPYPDRALEALVRTAIAEATQQFGQVCPECNGSGKYIAKNRVKRTCPCCDGGRIGWTQETRFAYFCQTLPVTFSRFKKYELILETLVKCLVDKRSAAVLALQGRYEQEESVARC